MLYIKDKLLFHIRTKFADLVSGVLYARIRRGSPCGVPQPTKEREGTTFSLSLSILWLYAIEMSNLLPPDLEDRDRIDLCSVSDGENSDEEEIEEGLLVRKRRDMRLRESEFSACLSTMDE